MDRLVNVTSGFHTCTSYCPLFDMLYIFNTHHTYSVGCRNICVSVVSAYLYIKHKATLLQQLNVAINAHSYRSNIVQKSSPGSHMFLITVYSQTVNKSNCMTVCFSKKMNIVPGSLDPLFRYYHFVHNAPMWYYSSIL